MSKILNLTPHEVNIIMEDKKITIPSEGGALPRVSSKIEGVGVIGFGGGDIEIPLTKTTFGEVENLPAPEEGVFLIVSNLVAGRCPDRQDLLVPGEQIRDDQGRVIGCRSLSRPS